MNVSCSSGKALVLLTAGWTGEVARGLVVNKSIISRVSLDKDRAVMGDLVKGGRKKLFLQEQNRWLKKKVKENPFLSPTQLKFGQNGLKCAVTCFEYIKK